MLFPWADGQFWLVTAIASWCAWIVFRQLLPRQKSSTSCGACASGTAACAKHASALTPTLSPKGSGAPGTGRRRPPAAEAEPRLVVLPSRRRG